MRSFLRELVRARGAGRAAPSPRAGLRPEPLECRWLLAAAPITPDTQANSFTVGEQSLFLTYPSTVAVNDQGDAVLVWSSREQDGDGWGVFARRVVANGALLGSEFQINQTTVGDQWRPSVAMDAQGNFVVVWQQGEDFGDGGRVFGRRYNSAGQAVTPEFRLSDATLGNESAPVVGSDRHGNFAVAWKSDNSLPLSGLVGRRFSPSGLPLTDTFSIQTTAPVATSGSVSLNDDGAMLAVWADFSLEENYNTAARLLGPTGEPLGPQFSPSQHAPGRQDQISATFTRDGQFVVVWAGEGPEDDVGVYARLFAADQTPLGPAFLVNTYTINMQVIPSVAADAAGNFTISFSGDGGEVPAPLRRKYSPTGVPLSGVETVTGNPVGFQGNGGVAVEPDGNFIINWDDSSAFFGRPGDIFFRRFAEPLDAAGPTVAGVYLAGDPSSLTGAAAALTGSSLSSATRLAPASSTAEFSTPRADLMRAATRSTYSKLGLEALESRRLLAASAIGGEFRVNSNTEGDQSLFLAPKSTLAVDDQGDAVAVWSSLEADGDSWGVYGQRVAADGSLVEGEFRINTHTAGSQRLPSVAMDGDGDFVVAWQDGSYLDATVKVMVRRYSASGLALGPEIPVGDVPASRELQPIVGCDRAGNFVVLWKVENAFPLSGLVGRRFSPTGQPLGPVFSVSDNLPAFDPGSIDFDESGRFLVCWSYGDGEAGSDVAVRLFAADGTPLTPPLTANDQIEGNQGQVHATFTQNGQFAVVWAGAGAADDIGVFARRFSADGAPQGDSTLVNTWLVNSQVIPSVAADADGNYTVVWSGDGADDGSGVYARTYDASGNALSGAFLINQTTEPFQGDGNIALEPDGNFIVNWQTRPLDGSDPGDVYARRFAAAADSAAPQVVEPALAGEPASLSTASARGVAATQIVLSFSEALSTAGGTSGANSASNKANYALSRDGVDISGQITSVSFAYDTTLRRQLATLELASPLSDGNYVVTAKQSLRDPAGNGLDGDFDGVPGGNFSQAFSIQLPPPATGPVAANTNTADQQATRAGGHSLATDADGDSVAVWSSQNQDGSGWGVYAQRFNAAGVAVGSEFRVPTVSSGDQLDAAVASDADGDFVVVWSSTGQDGSGAGVYAQRYTAAGVAWGTAFRASVTTSGQQRHPDLAMNDQGDFTIVWTSNGQDGSGESIWMRSYSAAGLPLGSERLVNSLTAGDQLEPSIAALADGGWAVAWSTPGAAGDRDVVVRRFAADGAPLDAEQGVAQVTAGDQQHPTLVSSPQGGFAVAWVSTGATDIEQVNFRQFAADGTPTSPDTAVDTTISRVQTQPALAWSLGGVMTIAWTGSEPEGVSTDVWARRYDATAAPLGPAFTLAALSGMQAAVGLDAAKTGALAVAWTQNTGATGDDVFFRTYAGQTDSQPPRVSGLTRVSDTVPLAANANLPEGINQLVVSFDENLVTGAGPTFPAGSVRNRQNWQLLKDGSDFSANLTSVAFAQSATSGHYEATLNFAFALPAGQYRLVARGTILDLAGNSLDGNGDGQPGGDAEWVLAVAPPTAIAAETVVNVVTQGDQTTQTSGGQNVARNRAGDSVVVWASQNQDGSSWGVYARRLAADGSPVGGEIAVNSTTAFDQREPAVALDDNGDFVVVWTSTGQDGSGRGVYARRFSAAGTPLTGEILVPQTTVGDQWSPSVGSDPLGSFLVAWTSSGQDGTGDEVYARRFSALGAALGGEFRVNTATADDQQLPSVAVDSLGNSIVAWNSRLQDGSGWGVYARRFNSDGRAITSEFRVNQSTAGDQNQARAAIGGDGSFAVGWASSGQDGSGTAVFARRYKAAASALGAEFQLNVTTAGDQSHPALALDDLNDLTAAWTSAVQDGDSGGIYARRFSSTGVSLSGEQLIPGTTAGNQDYASLAATGPGQIQLVWTSNPQDGSAGGVIARLLKPNEVPTTTGLAAVSVLEDAPPWIVDLAAAFADPDEPSGLLSYSITSNSNPALLAGTTIDQATDRLTLTFATNTRGQATLTVRATDSQGFFVETPLAISVAAVTDVNTRPLGPPILASTGNSGTTPQNSTATALAHDEAGNFVVVWANAVDGPNQIFGRRFTAAGQPLGQPFAVSEPGQVAVIFPDIAMKADGQFVVTWSQSTSSTFVDTDVYARRFAADGNPLGGQFLVNQTTADTQGLSQIAIDAAGNFAVTWSSGLILDKGVPVALNTYYRRYQFDGTPLEGEVALGPAPAQLRGYSQIGMLPGGGFIIVYSEGVFSFDEDEKPTFVDVNVLARRYQANGTQIGGPIAISQSTSPGAAELFATLAVAADGSFAVAWVQASIDDNGDQPAETRIRRFAANGAALGDEFLAGSVTGEPMPLGIDLDASGGLVVVARAMLDATSSAVWFREYTSTQAATAPTRVHDAPSNESGPAVAVLPDGRLAFSWVSSPTEAGPDGVYVRVFDTTTPRVTGVEVASDGGTAWIPSTGSGDQLKSVSLVGVNTIRITFSEDVLVQAADLRLEGLTIPLYAFSNFAYNAATFTATWTLATPISNDRLTLRLNSDGVGPVRDSAGNRLDGEWDNPASLADPSSNDFPSGDGQLGGDFVFRLNVLAGDANGDGSVGAGDYAAWSAQFGQAGSRAADFDGNGSVGVADYAIWAARFGTALPNPPAPAASLSATFATLLPPRGPAPSAGLQDTARLAAAPGSAPAVRQAHARVLAAWNSVVEESVSELLSHVHARQAVRRL